MNEPKDDQQDERRDELDEELQDLDVGDGADRVTGGSNDPCEGGQIHRPD
jgi:hypothetical protein